METWKPIGTHHGLYEVSDQGRVKSVARRIWVGPSRRSASGYHRSVRERLLTLVRRKGRATVSLWQAHEERQERVAVLVLEAFVGPRPAGHYACHRNDDPSNDALSNLYWGTPLENSTDKKANGHQPYGAFCTSSRLTAEEVSLIRRAIGTQEAIAQRFGTTQPQVSRIRAGLQRTLG